MNPAVTFGCVLVLMSFGQTEGDTSKTVPSPQPPNPPASTSSLPENLQGNQLAELSAADQKRLTALLTGVKNAEAEHSRSLGYLRKMEAVLPGLEAELKKARAESKTGRVAELEKEIASTRQTITSVKKRIEVIVKERNTLADLVESLRNRIKRSQDLLATKSSTGKSKSTTPSVGGEFSTTKSETEKLSGVSESGNGKSEDRKLLAAREQAKQKEDEAKKAQEQAVNFAELVASIGKDIEAETALLSAARERYNLAVSRKQTIEEEHAKRQAVGIDEAEKAAFIKRIQLQEKFINDARTEEKRAQDHLTQLQTDLSLLQSRQIMALQQADKKRQEAKKANQEVATLENPFAWQNILRWLVKRGPRVLMLLLTTFLLQRLVVRASRQVARAVARGEKNRRHETQESRSETLAGVFHHSLSSLVICVGGIMILDEAGIPVGTLLGGAAVIGLAVSFGAQNLIKDYFSGFMILMEDQYAVGDWIKINDMEGTVERITLRVTSLRNLSGQLHFIPHGSIVSVTNSSHTWSQALFDIGIAYKEDANRVIGVLMGLCGDVQRDPVFGVHIMGDPVMLGVDSLGDSAVVIRFFIKTKPNKHSVIRRELLRRIKDRFDAMGIEIPFPHRTVYHRTDEPDTTLRIERAA